MVIDLELAREIRKVLDEVPGFSAVERRLLASLLARRLQSRGWQR